ncbi:hypothetical protein J3R83DRAFT_7708, partial [Lanmaoa asiatica]
MDTPRSSTPVAEPGASESLFDSTQLTLPPQLSGCSSAVRRPVTEGGVQQKKLSLRQHAATLLQPAKVGPASTVWQSIRAIVLASYLNLLLICIPISWALNFALPNEYTLIFIFSFLAIIPLAKVGRSLSNYSMVFLNHQLLAFATDELSLRVGQILAGFINATLVTFSHTITFLLLILPCHTVLVLGMCFFVGGLRFSEQGFGLVAAQMNSTLLTISVIAATLPGAFVMALEGSPNYDANTTDRSILKMSHGVRL